MFTLTLKGLKTLQSGAGVKQNYTWSSWEVYGEQKFLAGADQQNNVLIQSLSLSALVNVNQKISAVYFNSQPRNFLSPLLF